MSKIEEILSSIQALADTIDDAKSRQASILDELDELRDSADAAGFHDKVAEATGLRDVAEQTTSLLNTVTDSVEETADRAREIADGS